MDQSERETGGSHEAQPWVLGFGAGAVILALLVAAYAIGFNQGEKEAGGQAGTEAGQQARETPAGGAEGEAPAEAAGPGKELFVSNCGSCHTLEAAGTSGSVGPDLDALAPGEDQVLAAIANGGAGTGQMPANLVTGSEAQAVAEFVAGATGGP